MWERLRAWWNSLFEDGLNHDWDGEWEPITDEEREEWEIQVHEYEKRFYAGQYNRYFK